MNEKIKRVTVCNVKVLYRDVYGYNNHNYVTLYIEPSENNFKFIGQLVDCYSTDHDFVKRIEKFLKGKCIIE